MSRPRSYALEWRNFSDRRTPELRDVWPGAIATSRTVCRRHQTPLGSITSLCVECRAGLFAQLAREFPATLDGTRRSTEMPGSLLDPDPKEER